MSDLSVFPSVLLGIEFLFNQHEEALCLIPQYWDSSNPPQNLGAIHMLKRLLKITMISLISLIVLGGIGFYMLGRTAEKNPQVLFNWLYKHPMGFFTKKPNALLMEAVSDRSPGKALDIAMGEGRNAVWLAEKGWDVTGFDISDEALRQANEKARNARVTIKAIKASSENFAYGHEQWDLIVMSYPWCPLQNSDYMLRVRDSLKHGGLLVFEHYRGNFGKQPGAIKNVFSGFEMIRLDDAVGRSDWGFEIKAPIVRVVATR